MEAMYERCIRQKITRQLKSQYPLLLLVWPEFSFSFFLIEEVKKFEQAKERLCLHGAGIAACSSESAIIVAEF